MSTGVEIIPIFIYLAAFAGTKYGLDKVFTTASNFGVNMAKSRHPHEIGIDFGKNISLQYDDAGTHPAPGGGDLMDQDVNTEELFGDFHRDREAVKIPTIMNDEELLRESLMEYGAEFFEEDEVVKADYEECRLTFKKADTGAYESEITGASSTEEATRICCEIMELYLGKAQQKAYDNVKSRAGGKGLILESEEIAQDNSIVLTFVVGEDG